MYLPPAFKESDHGVMLDFIEAHPFAALVTAGRSPEMPELFATHLPLVLERGAGAHGTLYGHVARANPHAKHVRDADGSREALVIFSGPNAYVTPSWYVSKQEHGRVVPTWNYVAVHAYGMLRLVDDAGFLRRHLQALTSRHEGPREQPWSIDDPPEGFIDKQATQIIGVELTITRLEGKWKMSQNRSAADIDGVIHGLGHSASPAEQRVGEIVQERRPASKG